MKKKQPRVICPKCGAENSGTKRCKSCGLDMFETQVEDAGPLNGLIKQIEIMNPSEKQKEKEKNQ